MVAMTRIHADELRPGDVVAHGDERHCITHVDCRAGWAFPIAGDGHGWGMALGHDLIDVLRTSN
jgi:hypothetical protein